MVAFYVWVFFERKYVFSSCLSIVITTHEKKEENRVILIVNVYVSCSIENYATQMQLFPSLSCSLFICIFFLYFIIQSSKHLKEWIIENKCAIAKKNYSCTMSIKFKLQWKLMSSITFWLVHKLHAHSFWNYIFLNLVLIVAINNRSLIFNTNQ